jgi:hypothetical protein
MRVARARVRAEAPSFPAWSLVQTNPVTWTITSLTPVALPDGRLRARLVDSQGLTAWEEVASLPLAPEGQGTASLTLPPIPLDLGSGFFEMVFETGVESDPIGASIRSPLRRHLTSWVRIAPPVVAAGDSGEVQLWIRNAGTVLEDAELSGEIEGIGPLAPILSSVPPGAQAKLSFPFSVGASVRGGLHRGILYLPNASPVTMEFSVSVLPPKLELSVEDRTYAVGELVPVTVRNTGGSRTEASVVLQLQEIAKKEEDVVLEAGEQTTLSLGPIPTHLPSGTYTLTGGAEDVVQVVRASLRRFLRVAGTSAALSVATDRQRYAPMEDLEAFAQVTNTGTSLERGALHLEIVAPCLAAGGDEGSYHIATWDGVVWVERAVRHRRPVYETDLVDLAAFLPDVDGEYKVRIEQDGPYTAYLDYAALLSAGSFAPPTEALLNGTDDVLGPVSSAGGDSVYMPGDTLLLRFPELPNPSLIFRAREGDWDSCTQETLWQQDYALDLAPAAVLEVAETLVTPQEAGQYILRGEVRSRDGEEYARAEAVFEVVQGDFALSLRTDKRLYPDGAVVPYSGVVENLSGVALSGLELRVYHKEDKFYWRLIQREEFDLGAGEKHPYASDVEAWDEDMNLRAEIHHGGSELAASEWSFQTAEAAVEVEFLVPYPPASLALTGSRLVAVDEADLDDSTREDDGALEDPLPFPVNLAGINHVSFRQSVDGFVELVQEDQGSAFGTSATCLDGFGAATVLAPFLGDLDPSVSGFVGHKLYPAGSTDRNGRAFVTDTLVFFWDAPGKGDTRHNQMQVLISRDGLIRLDTGEVYLTSSCSRSGVTSAWGELPFDGPDPFGVRVEGGVGREPFQGLIVLTSEGGMDADLELDYGRVDGPRTTASVTLVPDEQRAISFEDSVTAPTTYTLDVTYPTGYVGSFERTVAPTEAVTVSYAGQSQYTPGPTPLPFVLSKQGGRGGPMTLTFTLTGPGGAQTQTRRFDLEPGILTNDAVLFDLPEGALTLDVTSADVPVTAVPVILQAAPRIRVALTASAGSSAGGQLPVAVDVANSGLDEFVGTVILDGSSTAVSLGPGQSGHWDLAANITTLAPGSTPFTVTLLSAAAQVVAQQTLEYRVVGPRVVLASSPDGEIYDSGTLAPVSFIPRNDGDQRALGSNARSGR